MIVRAALPTWLNGRLLDYYSPLEPPEVRDGTGPEVEIGHDSSFAHADLLVHHLVHYG